MDQKIQNTIRTLFSNEFENRLNKNSKYSLRAFAKSLNIDPSTLSQFLRGKRKLNQNHIAKYLSRLGVDMNLLTNKNIQQDLDSIYPLRYVEDYEVLSKWYYLGIIECFGLKDFKMKPEWFSARLGVHQNLISQALDLLQRKKVIEKKNGKWKTNWLNISTQKDEDVDEVALREHQKQLLNLAAQSIDENSAEFKSHTAYVNALDPELIPELKNRIAKFRRETAAWIDAKSKNKTEVYCLQINLFPQTKKEKL